MLEGIIGVIIALGILAVVYILIKWIIGQFTLPAPLVQIVNIVFGIVAIVIVLRYLVTLI